MPAINPGWLHGKPSFQRLAGGRGGAAAAIFQPNLTQFRSETGTLAKERVAIEAGFLFPYPLAMSGACADRMRGLDQPCLAETVRHQGGEGDKEEQAAAVENIAGGALGEVFDHVWKVPLRALATRSGVSSH